MLSMALGALLTVTAPGAFAESKTPDLKETAKMASRARTQSEHAVVAQRYLVHVSELERKAGLLEDEVRNWNPGPTAAMEQKWPALMQASRDRKARLAMQARRAAKESRDLALHHSKLAGRPLEELAVDDDE